MSRRKSRTVYREIPEKRLSYGELWEQYLTLIEQVDTLWHELYRLADPQRPGVLGDDYTPEDYRDALAKGSEIADLVDKARTVEIAGITGQLDTGRELNTVRRDNVISSELGERYVRLRARSNQTLAKVYPGEGVE